MVLEAKRLDKPLTDKVVIDQLRNSARLSNRIYAVSCNGITWRIYDVSIHPRRAGFVGKLDVEIDLMTGANSNAMKLNRLRRRR